MFTYKHKKTGQVVKRDEEWHSAEESEEWSRVDNTEAATDPEGEPRQPVDQSHVDPEELAGGAPDEDVNPDAVPGEILPLNEMPRDELDNYASEVGVEDPHLIEEADEVIQAIRSRRGLDEDLDDLTRVELNDYAKKVGVDEPEDLPNKGEVIKAIEAHGG